MRRRLSAMPFPFGVPSVPFALRLSVCFVMLAAAGCGRLASHPLVKEAKEEVQANARVAAALGAPVECGKAAGVVVVEGKKTKNEWGVTMLELRPAGAEKLSLTADLEARTGTDTPKFDPAAKPTSSSAPPPGDIEIALPPGVPGQP